MVKIALLLSSYAPLFMLLCIRLEDWRVRTLCGVLAGAGVLLALILARAHKTEEQQPVTLKRVKDGGEQVAAYLATYILPLLMVSDPDRTDLVAYGLFLAFMGFIMVKGGYLQVNPLFAAVGYKLFNVETGAGWSGYVLSKIPLLEGGVYGAVDSGRGMKIIRNQIRGVE